MQSCAGPADLDPGGKYLETLHLTMLHLTLHAVVWSQQQTAQLCLPSKGAMVQLTCCTQPMTDDALCCCKPSSLQNQNRCLCASNPVCRRAQHPKGCGGCSKPQYPPSPCLSRDLAYRNVQTAAKQHTCCGNNAGRLQNPPSSWQQGVKARYALLVVATLTHSAVLPMTHSHCDIECQQARP